MAEKADSKWTDELNYSFITLRLQHECLFKKKKQAWIDFHKLLLENDFPPSISLQTLRKRWNYLLDEYHKAIVQNNKNWLYYDMFNQYLGNYSHLDVCSNWTNDWIDNLIDLRIKHYKYFSNTNSDDNEGWNIIEKKIIDMGLPHECSVRYIDKIWLSLIKTFKIMYKFCKYRRTHKNLWPFYDHMKKYYTSVDPKALELIKKRKLRREKSEETACEKNNQSDMCKVTHNESSNKDFSMNDSFKLPVEQNENDDFEEFRWTSQWTESFIHIRLQNNDLFLKKKQPWRDLHNIMMENGFPNNITIDQIRKKWISLYEDYQKALALNNKKWIYYDIIYGYLGDSNILQSFGNWNNHWIRQLIYIRIKSNNLFDDDNVSENDCWSSIECELRKKGIPSDCNIRNIHLLWSTLVKTFKTKYKYIGEDKKTDVWEFYDDMKRFFVKFNPEFLEKCLKRKKNDSNMDMMNIQSEDESSLVDNCEDKCPINIVKCEFLSVESCRACLNKSQFMENIFENNDIIEMISAITSLDVSEFDNLPKYICRTCLDQLEIAYKFRKKYIESDELLKSTYQSQYFPKIEPKKEPKNDIIDEITSQNSPHFTYDDDNSVEMKIDSGHFHKNVESKSKKNSKNGKSRSKSKQSVKKSIKKKPRLKSKNIVTIPVVNKTGETTYKRKYVYWKVCDICGKSTQRMSEHMKSHSEVKTVKCTKCPKTFVYTASLQTHMRTHDSTPLKVCQLCGKEFFRNLTYKRHLVCHANERKFSCDTCGKSFNTSEILKIHIRSHTGERPYSCETCGKSFYSSSCVSRHQKVHRKQFNIAKENENVPLQQQQQ